MPPSKATAEAKLVKEITALTKEVRKLKSMEFMKFYKKPWKLISYSFLRGIASGFGGVLGATVVVAIFIYILSRVSFVPVVGDFIKDVQQQIALPTIEEIS